MVNSKRNADSAIRVMLMTDRSADSVCGCMVPSLSPPLTLLIDYLTPL